MEQPGILSAQISLLAERGVVEYDPDYVDSKGQAWNDARVAEEIEDCGFEATVVERSIEQDVELRVYGLENRNLAPTIEGTSLGLAGVSAASLPPPHTHLYLTHSTALISLRAIIDALSLAYPQLTFLPTSSQNDEQLASLQKHKETALWRRTFVVSTWFAVPVFIVSMVAMYLPKWLMGWTMWRIHTGIYLGDLVCLCLTLPVQTVLARRFYENAWKSIKHGGATM